MGQVAPERVEGEMGTTGAVKARLAKPAMMADLVNMLVIVLRCTFERSGNDSDL